MEWPVVNTTIKHDPFDDWFEETHGTSDEIEIEADVDDCEHEDMAAEIDRW